VSSEHEEYLNAADLGSTPPAVQEACRLHYRDADVDPG
jgi:hypothetical protein